MRFGILIDERRRAVDAGGYPAASISPGDGIGFVAGHGNCSARFKGKGDHACGAIGLEFQLLGKAGNLHAPSAVASLCCNPSVPNVFGIGIGGASHHLAALAIQPAIGYHSVRCREASGGNSGMADARLGCGVGIGGLVEPRAFVDQAAQTAGPLMEEFVDVVAAHLVHHEQDHEFGTGGRLRCGSGGGSAGRRLPMNAWNRYDEAEDCKRSKQAFSRRSRDASFPTQHVHLDFCRAGVYHELDFRLISVPRSKVDLLIVACDAYVRWAEAVSRCARITRPCASLRRHSLCRRRKSTAHCSGWRTKSWKKAEERSIWR